MSNNGGHLTVQYNLRWSEELRDKIAETAKNNTRSMNQEIIARLEQSFEKEDIAEFDKGFVLQVIENQQNQIDQLQKMVKDLMNRPA
ncbi:MAG: Arc-like DNA binding domain protein [Podoviridae sp. ctbh1]|uniref:Arc family DNA-binding protein n=1 Tax=Acinetobacter sp. ANC5681 TaxID=2929504 RepID=UPI000DC1CA96|nr:Arc family DNA-binding protein [Acinetobacter sp. ANC5681]AWW07732.1 MAG: Arc-like DNA binding domain protein [Podoviridae sp. ctbh1]MCL5769424.1 Arc family DNA-binding protein [Acinetobacter sp. ANC5681]